MNNKKESYFDWEMSFKKKKEKEEEKKEESSTLGIPQKEYNDFIKEWKRKNLKDV